MRQRRALRRLWHEQRRRIFTPARYIELDPEGAILACVQGGVPIEFPRQLPSMADVREHAEVCGG
jgi:hypothetical protein